MISFGLIAEGLTDQIAIKYILAGYFNNPNIILRELQPELDKDDENKSANYGGWNQVLTYCQSNKFQEAFQLIDFIILQIDTDISENYGIANQDENGEFTADRLIEKVREKLIELMGRDFYKKYETRIIFAIAVHSIECWLLPLYYTDNRKYKIKNCLDSLNQDLVRKEGFTIDANAKNPGYYRIIFQRYSKRKILMKFYKENPSLKIFIEDLQQKNIVIEEEDF